MTDKKPPLFFCWNCNCEVREVNKVGLCPMCMPSNDKKKQYGTDTLMKALGGTFEPGQTKKK